MQYIVLFCMCHATPTPPPSPLPKHHHIITTTTNTTKHDTHINCKQTSKNCVKHRIIKSNWLWTLALNENVLTSAKNGAKSRHHQHTQKNLTFWASTINPVVGTSDWLKPPFWYIYYFNTIILYPILHAKTSDRLFRLWCLSQTQKSLLILSSIRRFLPAVFYPTQPRNATYYIFTSRNNDPSHITLNKRRKTAFVCWARHVRKNLIESRSGLTYLNSLFCVK